MPTESDLEAREIDRWNRTYVKVIGILGTALLGIIGAVVWWYVSGVAFVHQQMHADLESIHKTLAERGERITKLETEVDDCVKKKP